MAHNAYLATPGSFVTGYPLDSTGWETLNLYAYQALNGDAGGTWAPAAAIIIGGLGISLSGTAHKVISGGRLTVQSGGEFRVDAGATVTFNNNPTFNGAASFEGTAQFDDDAAFNSTSEFNGVPTFNVAPVVAAGIHYALSSRSVTRIQGAPKLLSMNSSGVGDWEISGVTSNIAPRARALGATLIFDLDVPHGSTLTGVSVGLTGSPTDVALPSTAGVMPTVVVTRRLLTTGVPGTVHTFTDTSVNLAAYQGFHLVGGGGLSEVIDRSLYRYFAMVVTESGTGTNVGSIVYDCQATCTVTALDDG